jgi:ATP-dependent DNA ligase
MNAYTPHPALSRPAAQKALCQLVRDYAGNPPARDGVIVEDKKDGWRMLWINSELVTREGAPIHGADHIAEQLRRIEHKLCRPMFFDGEFIVANSFDATQAHMATRGRNGDQGTLWLFDMMDMDVWRGDACGEALTARRRRLDALAVELTGEAVQILPWRYFETAADIEADAAEVIAAGGEGIVMKDPNAVYRRQRSNAWQRIKRSAIAEVVVTAALPMHGDGARLGTLLVDIDGVSGKVCAGFTNEQRIALWQRPQALVGRTAIVEMMERTASGGMRSAKFVGWK